MAYAETAAPSKMSPGQPASAPNFADAVGKANADVVDLLQRIDRLATRLVGPELEGKGGQVAPLPDGILPTVYFTAGNISDCAGRGHELLQRIEAALP